MFVLINRFLSPQKEFINVRDPADFPFTIYTKSDAKEYRRNI